MKFIYNGRIYNPVNIEKKLKKMGITINDIEVIPEEKEIIELNSIKKYYFKDSKGNIIVSIYPTLEHLKTVINVNEYEICR